MRGTLTSNLGRIYGVYTGGFAAFVLLLALLEQIGVPDRVIGYLFVIFTILVYAGIGILSRTMQVSEYYVAGRRVPAFYNGMATAADWMSAASFIGMAGTLYLLGYDGLAFVLGWTGGYVLVAVLIAPYLRKFGAYTVPDFLGSRYGGNLARTIGILVLFSCSFTYIVAQVTGTGFITSRFLDIPFEAAVFVGLVGILVCSMMGGMRAVTWTQVAQYIVLIVAYLLPVVILSTQITGIPVPQIAYGEILQRITELEQTRDYLAGAAAHLEPFNNYSPLNFFLLTACLMIGTASLPHVLMRFFTTPSVKDARRSVGWALLFIFVLYFTAPAYAAFAKLEIYQNVLGSDISTLSAVARLPDWLFIYGHLGLVEVCGIQPAMAETLYRACLEAQEAAAAQGLLPPDLVGVLTRTDFSIDQDVVVIAMPEIAGLPYVVAGLVAAGGLAAALSTADGLLLAIANALSHDIYYRMIDPKASTQRRLVVARMLLIIVAVFAALVAGTRPEHILAMVAWAFSLAAAGLFPALVMGVWWKRTTQQGAVAGMVAGFGITLAYLVGTEFLGMPQWLGVENIAAGAFGIPLGFLVTFVVSLLTPAPSRDMQEFIDALRVPRGQALMPDQYSTGRF